MKEGKLGKGTIGLFKDAHIDPALTTNECVRIVVLGLR